MVARFLAGAGAAAVIPVAIAWIGDVIPYERRQPVLARFISGQILGIVFGQATGGLLGELIGWRATMVVLGAVHIAAGLLLLAEMRRLQAGVRLVGRSRAGGRRRHPPTACCSSPGCASCWAAVFLEGMAMFGALAYVGADLHQRFGAGLRRLSAQCWPRSAPAPSFYVLGAGRMVARLGQPGLAAGGAVAARGRLR